MPPKTRAAAARKTRRKVSKNIVAGQAHIKSTFNNTIVSITDPTGAVISWSSAGDMGFKGSRKSTPTPHSWLLRLPQTVLRNTASVRLMFS